MAPRNPKTDHFEFEGPLLGPVGIIFGLPLLTYLSAYLCHGKDWTFSSLPLDFQTAWADLLGAFSLRVFAVYFAWFGFLLLLHAVVPGPEVLGSKLRDGRRLPYVTNGWACFIIVHILLVPIHFYVVPLTWVYDNWTELVVATITTSFVGSVALYAGSFLSGGTEGALLAAGGNSGHALYDFFIGRELNPRSAFLDFVVDWKFFCELRPGLWLWSVANIAFALKQVEVQGHVDVGLGLVLALQALYVVDSIFNESSILSTMDITDDGFGFMLCFGDLAWVPAMYSLQARFLAENPQHLSPAYAATCFAVALAGFYVFRASNAQKDTFRNAPEDPSVRDLPFIRTKTGSRLLTGGWWGASRHMNYLGDWLLSVGMSLPTGFVTPVTYFYPLYFAVLLIHRERRDHHKCAAKYGADWEEYCRRVPYRIVPYVY